MQIDISDIKLSGQDRTRGLVLPTRLTKDLAYFCGVMAGDGSISVIKEKHDYAIKCVGNPKDEKEFYNDVLLPVIKKVFGLNLNAKFFDSKTTYGFGLSSKALVRFLTNKIGLPRGKKYSKLCIPDCFKQNKDLVSAFIQGVADTDFCLALRHRIRVPPYPVVSGTSKSKEFIEEIAVELEKRGISLFRSYDMISYDPRYTISGCSITHRIELNGRERLRKWMKEIGFRSPKHLERFSRTRVK